jgi:hypothetical protein
MRERSPRHSNPNRSATSPNVSEVSVIGANPCDRENSEIHDYKNLARKRPKLVACGPGTGLFLAAPIVELKPIYS